MGVSRDSNAARAPLFSRKNGLLGGMATLSATPTPRTHESAGHTDLKSRNHYGQHRSAGGEKEAERRSPQGISVCKQVKPGGPVP